MKPLSLCIPVLKRYDLLRELLISLRVSTVPVDTLYIVNNGRDEAALNNALLDTIPVRELLILTPEGEPRGLAASWNHMIRYTTEERVISNDDIEFAAGSLEAMMSTPGDLVSVDDISMCSCFLLRDSCVEKVGYFDENISPGYAYFEDNDYAERMFDCGAVRGNALAGVTHKQSQTVAAYGPGERNEHSRRFEIAEKNFIAKWGFHPRDHRPGRDVWEPMPISAGGGGRRK